MRKSVWLSFDLGVNGDYESLYTWLANHEAKECGDGLAFLNYDSQGDLVNEVKAELEAAIDVQRKTRIYLIFRKDDGALSGNFLFGKRKQAPWTGYGTEEEESSDES